MKHLLITAATFAAFAGCATHNKTTTTQTSNSSQTNKSVERLERTATVDRYLINSQGEVDGLLLTDGMQVMIPSRYSKEVMAVAPPKQEIIIAGPIEYGKTIQAQRITNVSTNQSVTDIESMPPVESEDKAHLNATTHVQDPQDRVHRKARKQKKLSAQGTVQTQLYGPAGEVNGVILSDGSIVRFAPRMVNDSNVTVNVGENIQASGYGTKNSNGQSIEATTIKN